MLSMEYQTTIIKALTPASIWDWGWELLQLVIKILALELVGISGSHWEKKRDFKIRKIYMKENLPYMSIRSGREIPNMNNNLLNNIIAIKGIISENTIAMIFSNEPNSGRQNGFDMHRSLRIRKLELVTWSEAAIENNRNVEIVRRICCIVYVCIHDYQLNPKCFGLQYNYSEDAQQSHALSHK